MKKPKKAINKQKNWLNCKKICYNNKKKFMLKYIIKCSIICGGRLSSVKKEEIWKKIT